MAKKRSDGEGSVHQMHDRDCSRPTDRRGNSTCKCKWRGALVVGYKTGPSGKPTAIRKTVTAATKSGAATRLRELREQHAARTLPVGKSPTLEQWLNHCHARLLPNQKRRLRESTLDTYRGVFDNYLIPLLGHVRLDRLTSEDIDDAWQTLAETGNPLLGEKARPLSPTTVHYVHTILSRMLRLAVQKKQIPTNPAGPDAMDAPSPGEGEVEPLATEDWQKVRDAAAGVRNPARWTVALAIGLRQGEALALRWQDVDLDAGTLRVRQTCYRLTGKGIVFGPPKTDRSKREISLPDPLVLELRRHRKAQAEERLAAGDQWEDLDLVFCQPTGRPIDAREDRKHWHRLLERAEVAPVKLHAARHTAATIMLLQGVDVRVVMDIMGWSQISTAANYQHAVSEAKHAAASKMASAFWG